MSRHALDESRMPPEELPAADTCGEDNGGSGCSMPIDGEAAEEHQEPTVLFEQVLANLNNRETTAPPEPVTEFHDRVPLFEPEPPDVGEPENPEQER